MFVPEDVGQEGREISAPRTYVTDLIHPAQQYCIYFNIYRDRIFKFIFSVWFVQVCLSVTQTITRALL